MENYYINCISKKVATKWKNEKVGHFLYFEDNYSYRFGEMTANASSYLVHPSEHKQLPIVACGIVGYLLRHRAKKVPAIIFGEYLHLKRENYIAQHQKDADSWNRDLYAEFYTLYNPRVDEQENIEQSKALSEYIGSDEFEQLDEYLQNYFLFVEARALKELNDKDVEVIVHKEVEQTNANAEFKTDISQLCEQYCRSGYDTQSEIREGIEKQIIFQAQERYDTDPTSIYEYLKSEKENAHKCMERCSIQSRKEGAHLQNVSNMYIWNKERVKALTAFEENLKKASTSTDTPIPQQSQSYRQFTAEQIDILKTYFIAEFKGMGKNTKHFDENLLIDLRKNRVGIEYAKIAKLIYESPKSVREFKKKPFSQWYETFCNLMGIEKCKYKKSQITIDDTIKGEFYYLT